MVLADTSVWVDFARRGAQGRAAALRGLLDAGEVAICGPVVAELLAGVDGEVAERMSATFASLPWAALDQSGWQDVGTVARRLRRSGQTLPVTDLAIAVSSVRAGHVLWTFDSDFERIVEVVDGLELYRARNQ